MSTKNISNIAVKSSTNYSRTNVKENYNSSDHLRFLDMELHAQNDQFTRVINRKAINLLSEGLLMPAKFLKIEEGQLVVKVSSKRAIPRKGEYLTVVLLEDKMPDYRNWGDRSWYDIRVNHQIALSEAICVWQVSSENPDFNIVGFRGVSLDFSQKLITGCILVFGPKEPPREYLMNLRSIAEYTVEHTKFINFDYNERRWDPVIFDNTKSFSKFVLTQLELAPYLIVQGPPGTGKTYRLAELVSTLLKEGNRVLVTALTNRALIELIKKDHLQEALSKGLITKSNVTIDELREVPELQNKRDENAHGELVLSTFYIASKDAAQAFSPYYDYVIMDEASQALLGMFEATVRLGKKVVWVGDQNQLPPIVLANEKEISHHRCLPIIEGMKTVCEVFPFPSIMFNQTFRLSNRGAEFTSCFYANEIKSVNHQPDKYIYPFISKKLNFLFNVEGGPFWLKVPMPVGEKTPNEAIYLTIQIVKHLHQCDKKLHIAVLSKLKKTVTQLQVALNSEVIETEMILIDTVERVQGMTCDICFVFIPNTSLSMSLNPTFFNVATSRASRHTVIIGDSSLIENSTCKGGTRRYLERLDVDLDLNEFELLNM